MTALTSTRPDVSSPDSAGAEVAAAGPEPILSRPGIPSRVLMALIRGYQLARSGRPTGCRYLPTCSAYAEEAVARHGARRGGWLAVKRLARCHPWGGHGANPVPEERASC
jgi:putative membrane protein insertion efficiency factor